MANANVRIIMPIPPVPLTPYHHTIATGLSTMPRPIIKRHVANPAAKLEGFVLSDGRYMKPEPAECGGTMKIS